MISFKSYLREEYIELAEKLITFAGQAYPKFGHVIIMAGGAGSGKGFVKDNLIGAEGITFDVDVLKTMAAKTPAIAKKVKDELGVDLKDLASNLKDPENVSRLHEIIGDYLQLDDKRLKTVYKSIIQAHPDRKPNLIFDVTLKDLRKLQNVTRQVKALGYKNESIHIVWVVNDIEVAKAQNLKRSRTVPAEILVNTHRGASQTMNDIVNMGKTLKNYMDGDIVFAFNQVGVDSDLKKSGRGGQFIKDANYFYIKRAGKPVASVNAVSMSLRKKIASYVPKGVDWV
jgi:predicted kinase